MEEVELLRFVIMEWRFDHLVIGDHGVERSFVIFAISDHGAETRILCDESDHSGGDSVIIL